MLRLITNQEKYLLVVTEHEFIRELYKSAYISVYVAYCFWFVLLRKYPPTSNMQLESIKLTFAFQSRQLFGRVGLRLGIKIQQIQFSFLEENAFLHWLDIHLTNTIIIS